MPTIHLRDRGAGPAVLLLHGTPTTTTHFDPLAEQLASSHRVLIAELPGYGTTPALDPFVMDRVHEELEAALQQSRVSDVAIVGFSGGAYHAFALACRGRARVRGVVSLAGSTHMSDARERLLQTAAALRAGLDLTGNVPALFLSPRAAEDPAARAEVLSWVAATPPRNLANELEGFANAPDLLPAVAKLDIPILLRVGSVDAAVPPHASERIAAACRRATLQVVPGVGHALLTEDLEGTLAAVRAALHGMNEK